MTPQVNMTLGTNGKAQASCERWFISVDEASFA
jgi:hypothetical protein